ncbi:MAG: carbohydrate ABC transporter permease, partial [SAR324 cluster bacterium]|nr:carbohydrate ABC transporter permease [SAR324 cluster bacterium]
MKPASDQKFSFSKILNSTGLLFLVLLWILPTVGLLVSSFRDKDQLALTGWWTALSTAERNEFRRTGISNEQYELDGNYVISGKLLEPGGKL